MFPHDLCSSNHIQLFREILSEEMCTRQSRKGIWDMINTLFPTTVAVEDYFFCFPLALANTYSWPFVPILSNFFENKSTQNHPQCLSGLSRALFLTTFLEIAVYLVKCVSSSLRVPLPEKHISLGIYVSQVGELHISLLICVPL